MEEKNERFSYTYSATQQEEIQQIRKKYLPKESGGMEELRRLDAMVERQGLIASLSLGITGTLLLGVGLCCVLMWTQFFALGVVVGCIGIVGIVLAYPANQYVIKKEREKNAPRILDLTEELLHDSSSEPL